MDDPRRSRSDEKRTEDMRTEDMRTAPNKAPAEGVRIIGPDEAAEAMERGDVAARRTGDELRYGDRPPAPPAGPRPALRFPLDASADPTRIERPPVQPAPDPVTGPVELPHWTEPPTGEVPAVLIGDDGPLLDDEGDDPDAWSSFATSTPRWRDADDDWADDGFMERLAGDGDEVRVGALGDQDAEPSHEEYFGFDDLEERVEERTNETIDNGPPRFVSDDDDDDWSASADDDLVTADAPPSGEVWVADDRVDQSATAEVAHIDDTDGDDIDDDDDDVGVDVDGDGERRGGGGGYDGDGGRPQPEAEGDRDLVTAIAVGVGLAALAIILIILGPKYVLVLVAAILAISAVEYFGVLRKVGWESATLLGIGATVAFPFAIYWRGPSAFALVTFLSVAAILVWFLVGASGPDPRVLEGAGATLLGVMWIGGLGSHAAALLTLPDGTALFVTAILATVAYDIGGLFIGRSMGRRPVSAASPNKTVEGLIGGMSSAFVVAIIVVGVLGKGPWTGLVAGVALGVGAAVAAPLGDLCQSLLKRDLGVKDMSSVLPGHGGVLDRYDGMLFVFPTVFWLAVSFGDLAA